LTLTHFAAACRHAQATRALVPRLPSTKILYWPKHVDGVQMGRKVLAAYHWECDCCLVFAEKFIA